MTREELENEVRKYEELSTKLENVVSKSIEGSLKTRLIQSNICYYIRSKDGDKYLSKNDPKSVQTIKQLAQKDYCKRVLSLTRRLQKQLEKLRKLGFPDAVSNVYKDLSPARKRFVKPLGQSDDDYAREWLKRKESFAENNRHHESLKFTADNGTVVRSKSELIIANKLISRGIPFIYEIPVSLNGGASVIHPDFLVLNKRTRVEVYWEHFGMMDEQGYCKDALFKLNSYLKDGYVLGQDLVVTFESKDIQLDTIVLNKIIDSLFI